MPRSVPATSVQRYAIRGTELIIGDAAGSIAAKWVANETHLDEYGLARIRFDRDDIVVDIGAHVGIFAIYVAKRHPEISVLAFEPDPVNFANLLANIEANRVANVIPHRLAVTRDGRPFTVDTPPDNSGGAGGFHARHAGYARSVVESITLDDIFERHAIRRCKLLKIDCEGAEHEILTSTSVLDRVEWLSGEFHASELLKDRGCTVEQLMAVVAARVPPERIAVKSNRIGNDDRVPPLPEHRVMKAAGQTICLNMIVKNEAPVIRRCLDAVRPLIDHWVIVDTGSTDGTQDLIRDCLRDVPGELHERPWKDFAHNRSEALALARGHGDYVFVIDADEVLEIAADFVLPALTADSYDLRILYGGYSYLRKQLVRNALPWRYEGVVHEHIVCEVARTEQFLPGLHTVPHRDGARARDPDTYRRDARLLEQALADDPRNARNVFYLAQSYRDAGDLALALQNYKRRVELGGWADEVWYSLYEVAQLKQRLEHPWPQVMEAYLAAWQYDGSRAGPLYRIAAHFQRKGEYNTSHVFLSRAVQVPRPADDRLFVEQSIYDYQVLLEYAVACHYVGHHAEAVNVDNILLREGRLPPHLVAQVIENRRLGVDAMFPRKIGLRTHVPLRVVTALRDPTPALDDAVESLLRQEEASFAAVFLDDGSGTDASERIPSEDARFSLERFDRTIGERGRIEAWVRDRCAGDDLVVVLAEGWRLHDAGTLQRIRALFDDPNCVLAYGQWRAASGARGTAEPAPSEALFRDPAAAFFRGAPIAFRARLLQGLPESAAFGWRDLFDAAGFARTRFCDDVWAVEPASARPLPPAPNVAGGNLPLVSCLMTTYDRLSLAKHAIRSFAAQTYPEKELIVVSDGEARFRRALERYAAALGLARVRFVDAGPERQTLGRLRNISVEAATGDIVCQWDDDDYSHPERLRLQVDELMRNDAGACFLTDHLQFIEEQSALCWVDWTLGQTAIGAEQLAPGTMMMRRDLRVRYPEDGPYARQGEDSVLLDNLCRATNVTHLRGAGHLYLYQYHGRNTFPREHHYRLSNCRTAVAHLRENAARIREAVAHYPIARPCFVVGRDGPAFAID
jgi:FkbM family methyltransferase